MLQVADATSAAIAVAVAFPPISRTTHYAFPATYRHIFSVFLKHTFWHSSISICFGAFNGQPDVAAIIYCCHCRLHKMLTRT